MCVHQMARHRIIHDAHVLRRGGPPHRHRMARLHVILACCLLLMMARLVKVNGHPPSLQSTLQRCKGMLLMRWGMGAQESQARQTDHLLSPRGHWWHIYRKPEYAHLGGRSSCPTSSISLVVVGSERDGVSSRH